MDIPTAIGIVIGVMVGLAIITKLENKNKK